MTSLGSSTVDFLTRNEQEDKNKHWGDLSTQPISSDLTPSLKLRNFYPSNGDDSDTVSLSNTRPLSAIDNIPPIGESTVPIPEISYSHEDDDEHEQRLTWQKDVEFTRTAATIPVPSYPRIQTQRHAKKHRTKLFWIGLFALISIILGGVFSTVVTHGLLNASLKGLLSLQVTPGTVEIGAMLTLRGSNFSPSGGIGLTHDTNIPVVDTGGHTIIQADADGSFTDTVVVPAQWLAGVHSVNAEDAFMHKTARSSVVVTGQSTSLRPAHLRLSASTLDFGSADQASNTAKVIMLTNAGGGPITWQGATTQPWLVISPKNGTFAAGEHAQVTIAVERAKLKPGPYSAQIIFSSNAGESRLPVTMQVTLLDPGQKAVLQVTPVVLSFTATDGGASPSAQTVTISNPGVKPLQWSASSNASWLSLSSSSGSVATAGNTPITVSVDSSSLLPGTYSGVVTFSGQDPASVLDSPQSVYVSVTIYPQCTLQVSPGLLSFTGVYLQPTAPSKVITIGVSQGCTSSIAWSASSTANWLSIDANSGNTPSYQSLSVNISNLTPGPYNGTIVFNSSSGTQTLPVSLTVGQPTTPIMATSPSGLTFNGVVGQPTGVAQTVTISNTGGGTLNWSATATTQVGGQWVSITPKSGSLTANQSASPQITATLLAGLIPGTYNGLITITGTDSNGKAAVGSPQTIPVTFTVQSACAITANPQALSFAGIIGQSAISDQSVAISASGACLHQLDWTATANTNSGGTWLSSTSASGSVSLATAGATSVGVALSGLTTGTYHGTITIKATDGTTHAVIGAPQIVLVTFTVQPACTMNAPSASTETFTAEQAINPQGQSFTAGVSGTCTGKVTITPAVTLGSGSGWLAVNPNPVSVPTGGTATFSVTINTTGLAAGSYTASITLNAANAGVNIAGSGQTIGISLKILTPPALSVSPGSLTFNVTTGASSQPLTISNTGGEPLDWQVALPSNAPPFISLSPPSGHQLGSNANATVNVTVDATGLAGGTSYTTSITVSAIDPLTGNATQGSAVTVSVTINVAAPSLQTSATSVNFTASLGAANPLSQRIVITNTGGDGLQWTISAPSSSWLSVSPTSGSDASGAKSTITFSVSLTGLVAGSYNDVVTIKSSAGSLVTMTISLTVA